MKKWYESKIVWASVITTLLGVLPIVGVFAKLIEPEWAVLIDGSLVMVVGILNVIWRVWFTNTTIATKPTDWIP